MSAISEIDWREGVRFRWSGTLPLGEHAWVGVLIRESRPSTFDDDTVLEPGDRVHVYCQPEDAAALERIFAGTSS